jgi:heme o synthase
MLREEPVKERAAVLIAAKARDYQQLLKPNLSGMVVFSSVIGYLMAPATHIFWRDISLWRQIIELFIGGMLVTGSANTINQILERDSDILMARTRLRPMPDGRMNQAEAWLFAGFTSLLGFSILAYYFNAQCAVLSIASLFIYAFAYTPMKKVHPIAVLIGAVPGALPPLIGWVAATGQFGIGGWVLFAIQFFWQFPHFWAIAWVAFDDYNRAGIRMLPTRERETRFTGLQCMFYSLVLIPMALLPRISGLSGNRGMWVVMICGFLYFLASVFFYKNNDYKSARRVMFTSFVYLPVAFLALLIDKT